MRGGRTLSAKTVGKNLCEVDVHGFQLKSISKAIEL